MHKYGNTVFVFTPSENNVKIKKYIRGRLNWALLLEKITRVPWLFMNSFYIILGGKSFCIF